MRANVTSKKSPLGLATPISSEITTSSKYFPMGEAFNLGRCTSRSPFVTTTSLHI